MEEVNIRKTPEEWVEHYQKNYIGTLTLDTATRIIKSDMTNMARTCVSIGFHLKAVRDRELFLEEGYESIWEYAADQFGLSTSSASRYMTINDQFSVGGNTPQLQEEYQNFSKSQLQEMITMSDEQRQQVTEGMTVKEIRQLKNPEPAKLDEPEEEQIQGQMEIGDYPGILSEEKFVATSQRTGKCLHRPGAAEVQQDLTVRQVSVYGLPARTYPPDSLVAISGCGTLETGAVHDCSSCHMEGCQIRQEDCYCVEAPMGNPFPCMTLKVVENLQEELGEKCQFVNHDLAYHRIGDHEPVPCCKDCENLCIHACDRTKKVLERMGGSVPEKVAADPVEAEQEEKLPDENWNIGELPQAKESLLKQLARVLIEKMGDNMVISNGRLSMIIPDETAREKIQELDRIEGGSIKLQDNVVAYASAEIIEFYREEEDLGVCSYARFGTQVRKVFDEWLAAGQEIVETPATPEKLFEEITELSEFEIAQKELEKSQNLLDALLGEFTENDKRVRKQKVIVAALASFVCDLDLIQNPPPAPEPPELPVMKNNDQRKEWLRNYKDWGLWYEDEHIGVRYYKYEFANGAVLIAEEYDCSNQYAGNYTTSYLHLVGGPEPPKHSKYGLGKWQRNERYNRYPNNETELVEFLKEVQKNGKE